MSRTLNVVILLFFTLVLSHTALAESPASDPQPVIEVSDPAPRDSQIHERITGIFAEISPLKGVEVVVNEGVVSLSGQVANEEQAQSALRLANRISGVVTVQDQIERTLNVEDNISPLLDKFHARLNGLIKALPLILIALLVLLVVAGLGRYLANRTAFWQRITPNPFIAEILSQAVGIGFFILGLLLALSVLGAQAIIGTLLGGAGVIGIAVGFAVRDSIENYIASIMLSIRQPFRANDHVVIDDKEGIVVRLTSRATILMTLDGNHLRIPNAQVFKGIILNYSTNPERRFDFMLGVDADDDPVAAMQVGLAAVKQHDFVLQHPAPGALIDSVGDSNIVLKFSAWVNQNQADFMKARSLAIRAAKNALEENGFSLPEPIYRLRFDAGVTQALASIPATDTYSTPPAAASADIMLSDQEAAQVLDIQPDSHLQQKVTRERENDAEQDLLDEQSPKE